MQTTTTNTAAASTETAPAKTKEQIAREVAKNLAAAIMDGASAESLAALDVSWHADVKNAVEALDDFYVREANQEAHLLCDVLLLNTQSGVVWVSRLSSNEQLAGETNGTIARLAERAGELPILRMYGRGADMFLRYVFVPEYRNARGSRTAERLAPGAC